MIDKKACFIASLLTGWILVLFLIICIFAEKDESLKYEKIEIEKNKVRIVELETKLKEISDYYKLDKEYRQHRHSGIYGKIK